MTKHTPSWVLEHPLYADWCSIVKSGAGMHPPWRESPELFIREMLKNLGKPPWLSAKEWQQDWLPPAEEVGNE